MSWESPVNYSVGGEDLDLDLGAFLGSLSDFDGQIEPAHSLEDEYSGQSGQGADDDPDSDGPKVLTIMASIDAIHRHLENERKKGNGKANVAIKLKDPTMRKSITFSIPELQSPTTTASSAGSPSCAPLRLPSPEAFDLGEAIFSHPTAGSSFPEEVTPAAEDDVLSSIASPFATPEGLFFPQDEDVLPSIAPLLKAANLAHATEPSLGLISPRATASESSMMPDEEAMADVVQYRDGTGTTPESLSPGDMEQDEWPHTVSSRQTRSRQAARACQTPSTMSTKDKKCIDSSSCSLKQMNSQHQKRNSIETAPSRTIKRPRVESPDLLTLIPNHDEYQRVQELTAALDPLLAYKMVRNARAILPQSVAEDMAHSADMEVDGPLHYQNNQQSPSSQEEIMQQFCETVRRIEWVERAAFKSMVEYRVLFVQLYQHYLRLQEIVVTRKGERRVTLAKEQLYRTLYPGVEKMTSSGLTSDEWEKFNRCIRRGKQWNTIASKLGVGILQRMPSSICHSWVEQKLQTKEQLHIWIEIVSLLA
uniref:Hypothemycin biosynthesis cluster protein hpm4 n=1 Tax=Hypomyces subiculosus TaxID=193393 RepID=HPM4_HYPSB|nr:RecName: Full=Hypothemycin biosynthesis cluster protein hpm4 [Hypomyces subiculosus]ACD39754.1 hypothetical protein [Hypomyces subiculosus]ACD39763.1 hypothetical protein [Hypomyces subiculosus]